MMMNHEDWLAAVEAGYELGFSLTPEEVPPRDTWADGDERHQAFVAGLDSGQSARVAADAEAARRREFFDQYVRPIVDANLTEQPFAEREAIRKARIEDHLAKAAPPKAPRPQRPPSPLVPRSHTVKPLRGEVRAWAPVEPDGPAVEVVV